MAHHVAFLWMLSVLLLQNSVLAEDGEIRSSKHLSIDPFCYQQIDYRNQIREAQAMVLRILLYSML